ncbi:uncharacterized protein LOC115928769 [Strongylocentrotus purpuratus]|uniref:C-type lectin n=1 Tax=Strongylocentrotus purpuratus TaxID=7668 RepID=A0A7M7PKM3_STRPU|nr:uncharacterized protein LOC115928769 [Strongylocentrotus purpuratus]
MKFASEETVFITIIIAAIVSLQGVRSQSSSPEWHRLDDAVYLVDNITLEGYDEAQARCRGYGANLARIDSDEIQSNSVALEASLADVEIAASAAYTVTQSLTQNDRNFLTSFIPVPDTRGEWCFWIGCNDREVEGQFRWLDGTPVIYDGWAPKEPNNDAAPGDENYNFHLMTLRTNPGFASVYCAVDVEIEGETLSPDNVTLSIGQNLSSSKPISFSSTSLDGEFRNNSFLLDDVNEDDQIFCYAGELPDKDGSFSLATFSPVLDFYALPELPSGPTVGEISSSSSVTVSWSSWIPFMDSGDGPVVAYLIYQQTMGEEWIVVGSIDSSLGDGDLQRIMEFVLTDLELGTEYNVSVSAVREGPGGEGPRSPLVTVTTPTLGES